MPQWSNEAPAENADYAHRILRTPPDKPLCGIITTPDLVGCPTHFTNNRTIPCEAPKPCKPCDDGCSRRWHGYVGIMITPTLEHAIFEMTGAASDPLKNYAMIYNTLRACWIKALRPSKRSNGRVIMECRKIDETKTRIPEPFNVMRVLCHIWNVDYCEVEVAIGVAPHFHSIGQGGNGNQDRDTPALRK